MMMFVVLLMTLHWLLRSVNTWQLVDDAFEVFQELVLAFTFVLLKLSNWPKEATFTWLGELLPCFSSLGAHVILELIELL